MWYWHVKPRIVILLVQVPGYVHTKKSHIDDFPQLVCLVKTRWRHHHTVAIFYCGPLHVVAFGTSAQYVSVSIKASDQRPHSICVYVSKSEQVAVPKKSTW